MVGDSGVEAGTATAAAQPGAEADTATAAAQPGAEVGTATAAAEAQPGAEAVALEPKPSQDAEAKTADVSAVAAEGPRGEAITHFAARRPGWRFPDIQVDLKLASDDVLRNSQGRSSCPKCARSRALYCYDCRVPFTDVPVVTLPFHFSIITHKDEPPSKNTGVQAAIMAPTQVQLHSLDECPPFDASRSVVMFPSEDALEVCELQPDSIDRVFIIDSKWQKAKELCKHPSLKGVRCVKLPTHVRSSFWRFKTKGVGEEGVCTVEAMFYFLQEMGAQGKLSAAQFQDPHCFDNLLWYFVHQHKVVQEAAVKKSERMKAVGGYQPEGGAGSGEDGSGGGGICPGTRKQKRMISDKRQNKRQQKDDSRDESRQETKQA